MFFKELLEFILAKLKLQVNKTSKDTSGTGRIRTQRLSLTSKGKMNKHILRNKEITDDKPS